MKRNPAIEALRFLFMLQICLWHFSKGLGTMEAGFLGVEFFFILSGIFIYKNLREPQYAPGIIKFTYNKISKFYFEYVIGLLLTYLICIPYLLKHEHSLLYEILRFIAQLLFLQDTGAFPGGFNTPTWFFSILIWSGALVYSFTRYYQKISLRLVFPISFIFFITYCFQGSHVSNLENWDIVGFLPMPLIRGFVDISYGVLIGYLVFNYKKILTTKIKFFNFISFIAVLLYIFIVFIGNNLTQYAFILIPIIIAGALTQNTWINNLFQNHIWVKLGKLSFSMFIIHYFIIRCLMFFNSVYYVPKFPLFIVFLIILVPVSFLFSFTCIRIKRLIKSKF